MINIGVLSQKTYAAGGTLYPTDHLIERWSFNNTLIGDINALTFVKQAGTTTYASGKVANCLVFDGNTYFLAEDNLIKDALAGTHACTFVMWLKDNMAQGAFHQILTSGPFSTGTHYYQITEYWNNDKAHASRNYYGVAQDEVISTNNFFRLNYWNQLVLVYNGTNMQIYINSVADGSAVASSISIDSQTFTIGADTAGGQKWTGNMELFYFYDKALSQSEIDQLYNGGAGI